MEKKRYTNTMMWRCYRLRIVGPTLIPLTVNASVTHTQRHSLSHGFSAPHHVSRSHWTHSLFLSLSLFFFCVYFKSTLFHFCSHTSFLSLTRTHTHRERNFSFFANQRGTLFSSLADCFPFLLSRVRVSRLFLRSTRFFLFF